MDEYSATAISISNLGKHSGVQITKSGLVSGIPPTVQGGEFSKFTNH
jgi:hypothetical protein